MLFVPPDAAMKVRWLHSAALLCMSTSFCLIPSFPFFFPGGPCSAEQVRQVTRESQGRKGPDCAPWGLGSNPRARWKRPSPLKFNGLRVVRSAMLYAAIVLICLCNA